MSNQTITGNALQFTNDNQYCYAASGVFVLGSGATVTAIDFVTPNNSYIIANVQAGFTTRSNDDTRFQVEIDDNIICSAIYNNSYSDSPVTTSGFKVILPPNVRVKIIAHKITGTVNENIVMWLEGKVGMPPRVGNK